MGLPGTDWGGDQPPRPRMRKMAQKLISGTKPTDDHLHVDDNTSDMIHRTSAAANMINPASL